MVGALGAPAHRTLARLARLIAGVNLASPLYHVYAARFSFSPLALTAIFSTYAIVLVPALVLFGRLSDRFGRRPVLASGLATGCVGLILFAAAQGEAWLFTARAVQGLAVAMVSCPATAALVELDPDGDRRRAALGAGLAQTLGAAVGPIFAGLLAEFAPYRLRLSYLVVLLLTLAAAIVVLRYRNEAVVRVSRGGPSGLAFPRRSGVRSCASP